MSDERIAEVLERPEFATIDTSKLPASVPLDGIIANDTRLIEVEPGELVLREGDYGHSAFLVLQGRLRVVLKPGLPAEVLGRSRRRRRRWSRLFAGLLPRRRVPEARELRSAHNTIADWDEPARLRSRVDVAETMGRHRTAPLKEGDLFGELGHDFPNHLLDHLFAQRDQGFGDLGVEPGGVAGLSQPREDPRRRRVGRSGGKSDV